MSGDGYPNRELVHALAGALDRMLDNLQLAVEAVHALEASLPPEPEERSAPGRPRVVPTVEQRVEVVRLRYANGRLGLKRIAKLVNKRFPAEGERKELNWEHVQAILAEHAASENSPKTSEKPSRRT